MKVLTVKSTSMSVPSSPVRMVGSALSTQILLTGSWTGSLALPMQLGISAGAKEVLQVDKAE